MERWPTQLLHLIDSGSTAVLVTVAQTRGSAPRDAGAHMVVGKEHVLGSIGGGTLEYRAIELAHEMRTRADSGTRVVRFALGASAGQCCGGVVWLSFEYIDLRAHNWVALAAECAESGGCWGRVVKLQPDHGEVIIWHEPGQAHLPSLEAALQRMAAPVRDTAYDLLVGFGQHAACACLGTLDEDIHTTWLIERAAQAQGRVHIFGAGHVGQALVEVLARLPFKVRWIDERIAFDRTIIPPGVLRCQSDSAVAEWSSIDDDDAVLVMTHSHVLDFELVLRGLNGSHGGFLGLIGSAAKRASFVTRLRARGVSEPQLMRLHCPIGLTGISGKAPEVIALAVAAQLMTLHPASPAGLSSWRANRDNSERTIRM